MVTGGAPPPCADIRNRCENSGPQEKMTPVSIFLATVSGIAVFLEGNRFPRVYEDVEARLGRGGCRRAAFPASVRGKDGKRRDDAEKARALEGERIGAKLGADDAGRS